MSVQVNELRLQLERINYDNKESSITIDILREQNQDAKAELEEVKTQIQFLKTSQTSGAEDKEQKKKEKMAQMMAKFDTQGVLSEKEEQLREILAKLDNVDSEEGAAAITAEDLVAIRRQLADGQAMMRETVDRLRHSQEENEMIMRRRDELEERLSGLEAEYEELLGEPSDFLG